MASNAKKAKLKCHSYLVEYFKFEFVPCSSNIQPLMFLLCDKTLTNEAMKPSRLKNHLRKIYPDKVNKPIEFFQALKESHARSSLRKIFSKQAGQNVQGLTASYKVSTYVNWKKKACLLLLEKVR